MFDTVKNSSNWPQRTPTLNIEWGQIDPKGNRGLNKEKTVCEACDEEFHCLLRRAELYLNISYPSQSYEMTPKCENMMFDLLACERQMWWLRKKKDGQG